MAGVHGSAFGACLGPWYWDLVYSCRQHGVPSMLELGTELESTGQFYNRRPNKCVCKCRRQAKQADTQITDWPSTSSIIAPFFRLLRNPACDCGVSTRCQCSRSLRLLFQAGETRFKIVATQWLWDQGVSPHFCDGFPLYKQSSLWEALFVVSEKWESETHHSC